MLSINQIKDRPNFIDEQSVSFISVTGSRAYGTATETSDYDFYGFVVPPPEYLFPSYGGQVNGFGNQKKFEFNQWQVQDVNTNYGKSDITIYNIARYFHLTMNGNPNMIDSLFSDEIILGDKIGRKVVKNKHLFLSQKMYHTFKGMAFSHMNRIENRTREGIRKDYVEKYGYDVKDASHIVRLILELEQVLFDGELYLNKNREVLTAIRNGLWRKEDVKKFFNEHLDFLENNQSRFMVPYSPDEKRIKLLLIDCIEEKYGNLEKFGYYKKI